MEPVNGLNQLMEILRRQIAENARQLDHAAKVGRRTTARAEHKPGKPSANELRTLIRDRIRHLDSRQPDFPVKAKRVFFESVMAWEFGNEIVRDQDFDELVASVQEVFESTPERKHQFDGLIDQLSKA